MQFLMGLNENYDQSRSQILMVEPTPTINKAYAMLVERESQRSLTSSMSGEGTDLAALMAGKRMPNRYAKGTSQSQQYSKGLTSQSQSSTQHYNRGKKNWDKICDFCNLQGHVEDDCFRLHGYPPGWKFKKKGTGNNANHVQADNSHSMQSGVKDSGLDHSFPKDLPRAPQLTIDQHGSILQMFDGNTTSNVMANMAGMVHTPRSKVTKLRWIIDSGATNHMVSVLDVLHDVKTVKTEQNMKVYLPNGGITMVTHTGSYKITDIGILHDVLYVPDFHYNLLL